MHQPTETPAAAACISGLTGALSRRRWLAHTAGALALGPLLSPTLTGLLQADPIAGRKLADWSRYKLEGTKPDLKDKVALIDFWASWCGPCREAFGTLRLLHKEYAAQGLVIVAISVDEDRSDMDTFLKEEQKGHEGQPVPFTILRDPNQEYADKLKVEGMPTGLFVNRSGKVVSVHAGYYGEETRKKYLAEAAELVKISPVK